MIQSVADFRMALSAIDFLCELDEDQPISRIERRRYRCFEDAATVAYWRPFSPANQLPLFSFKQVGISPTQEQLDLHRKIEVHRNKVIAHSDAERMRILFTTTPAFGGKSEIMMPYIDFDDSLVLFADRWRWMEWVRTLLFAAIETLMIQVRGEEPIHYLRDWHQSDS